MDMDDTEFQPGEVDCPDGDEAECVLIHLDAVRDYVTRKHGEAWTKALKTARQRRWRRNAWTPPHDSAPLLTQESA